MGGVIRKESGIRAELGQYRHATSKSIASELNEIFAAIDSSHPVRRAAGVNFLLLLSSAEEFEHAEQLLTSLAVVHPGRFFILCPDPHIEGVRVNVGARCHLISRTDQVCSDVIGLYASEEGLRSLPSVLRAHLLTGVPTELFVMPPVAHRALVDAFATLSDLIILDSRSYERDLAEVEEIMSLSRALVDIEWIGLASWRDQIKLIFDRPTLAEELRALERVTIRASTPHRDVVPASAALLSGWIVDRLGVVARGYGRNGFECVTKRPAHGEPDALLLSLEVSQGSEESRVDEVEFRFGAEKRIVVRRGASLETIVEIGQGFKMSRPLDPDPIEARLERFFVIGESTINFKAALRAAIQLEDLRRAFVGAEQPRAPF